MNTRIDFDGAQKDLHVKEKLHLGALKDIVVR